MTKSILRKLLPGILPLVVFILVDELWGTTTGLFAALGFGVSALIFYYIRDKKIDRFILLDTGLLLVLGAVSIVLENDLFFKIKPAMIEAILLAVIAFSLWGPRNIIMEMSQRYTGVKGFNDEQEKMMRMNMKAMLWITAGHIVLVLYSARYMSDEAWAFISSGLFYILFGAWFASIWIFNRLKMMKYKKEEWFPVVDEDGKITGSAPRSVCHNGKSKLLHPVVHLHLFDKNGNLLLQKRSMSKDIQPGKWDTSVGGHIAPGEKIDDALMREASEELGIKKFDPEFIHNYVWESERERELVFSFVTVTDQTPVADREEIDETRFWKIEEIRKNIGKGIFTPNFEKEFSLLSKNLRSY